MTAKKVIIVGLIVLMLESIAGYIYLTYRQDKSETSTPVMSLPDVPQASASPAGKKASLILQSANKVSKIGETFKVDLLLNTYTSSVSAADVVVKYDPSFLTPQSSASATPFVPTPLLKKTVFNALNNKQGLATMSAVADSGDGFTGSNILSSLNFKTLKPGLTEITIVFTPGETRDTNIVSGTEDILESATGLSINILP